MKQLCIIPCGKKKIWDVADDKGEVPAAQAYVGALHRKSQAYSRVFCEDFRILSAKHGFLGEHDLVAENYDVSFSDTKSDIISIAVLKKQALEQELFGFDRIVALTGKKYKPFIEGVFEKGPEVIYPLQHYPGIGYILQALQQAVEDNRAL